MNLDKGALVYVLVTREWLEELSKNEILGKRNTSAVDKTVRLAASILDAADPRGLWVIELESDDEFEIFIPWSHIVSIATNSALREHIKKRRAAGFTAK